MTLIKHLYLSPASCARWRPGPGAAMLLSTGAPPFSSGQLFPFQAREDPQDPKVLRGDSTSHALLNLTHVSWRIHPVPETAKRRSSLGWGAVSPLFMVTQPITFKVGDGELSIFQMNLFLKAQF